MKLRLARPEDAVVIADIYAPYVTETAVSLEDRAPSAGEIAARIEGGGHLHPWIVAEEGGELAGYASASAFRPRLGYRFTVETSVYVAPGHQRRGVARTLYETLLDLLIRQGFTEAIAAITLPNVASARLHEAFGFERCGVYRGVGWKLGQWWDVGLWQRRLAEGGTPPAEPLPFTDLAAQVLDRADAPPSRRGR